MACSCSKNRAQPTGFAAPASTPREGAQAEQRRGATSAIRSGQPLGAAPAPITGSQAGA